MPVKERELFDTGHRGDYDHRYGSDHFYSKGIGDLSSGA
jgi:hypothetical protein